MIWNLLCSDHLLASAILLYHSNHSLGSSASVPPNSVGLTWFDSLSTWFTPKFAPANAFISAVTFGSNPPAFPPGGGLKPPPNPLRILVVAMRVVVVDCCYYYSQKPQILRSGLLLLSQSVGSVPLRYLHYLLHYFVNRLHYFVNRFPLRLLRLLPLVDLLN